MATPTFGVVFNYDTTTFPIKEFDCYQYDPKTGARGTKFGSTTTIPTVAAPWAISLPAYGTYELLFVAVAQDGTESQITTTFLNALMPPVSGLGIRIIY